MARVQYERPSLSFGPVDLAREIGARSREEHVHPAITGAPGADRSDGCGVTLLVSDPELKIRVLEKGDLGDWARIVMHPTAPRQHACVSGRRQRNAGVADRVGPLGDS